MDSGPVKINKNGNTVSVRLNTFFYPRDFLELAAKDFAGVAQLTLTTEGNYTAVVLKPKQPSTDLAELAFGFCNYALGLIQERG